MEIQKQRDLFSRKWRMIDDEPRETAFHIQLVSILRWCVRPDVIWRHIPNGGWRDDREGAKLKAMGTLPGSADLEFHWLDADKRRRVLHLELKVGTRPLSNAQASFALAMRLLGDDYEIARSVDEAKAILEQRGLLRPDRAIA